MQKKIRLKLLLVISFLFLLSCSYAQNSKNTKDSSDPTKSEKEVLSNIENLLKNKFCLRIMLNLRTIEI